MEAEFGLEYPHFHDCAKIVNKSECIASIALNIDTRQHIYLIDHVFGDKCFVPATMIMEIFLEAALWYERLIDPNTHLYPNMLLNLNIERAIAIDPNASLQVTVNILDADRTKNHCNQKIEIVSHRLSRNGKVVGMRLNASCEIVLSAEESTFNSVVTPDILFNRYSVDPEKWYRYLFPSLLECFHGSTGDVAISHDGNWLLGIYNCADKESRFIKSKTSHFISSPLGNDTCLQYGVFLARYIGSVGRLPVGAKKITLSRSYPKRTDVQVLVNLLDIDQDNAILDIVSFDQNDQPIFRAEEFCVRTSPFQSPLDRNELLKFFNCTSTGSISKTES